MASEHVVVDHLIRFGRRPCVRIMVYGNNPSASLEAYAQRVADVYIRGGLNVTHVHDKEIDFFVSLAQPDVAFGRVCMYKRSFFSIDASLRLMWRRWPVNPVKNYNRIKQLSPAQLDTLIEHYTDEKHLLHRLYTARQYNKALYDTAVAVHRTLYAHEAVHESFELTPGQDVTAGARAPAARSLTMSVHVKYRLVCALADAIRRAQPVLLLSGATLVELECMEQPDDP